MTNPRPVRGQVSAPVALRFTADGPNRVPNQETAEGKMLVDAAKAANVKLLVWSGIPYISKISGGKYVNAFICDDKALVTEHAKSIGVPFVNVQVSDYMQNFLTHARPKKLADGTFSIIGCIRSDALLPHIDTAKDYGLFVRKAIEQHPKSGTEVYAYSKLTTFDEIARILGQGGIRQCLP